MLKFKIGNLIEAAKSGEVNVIAHGCNCYNTMGSGIAPQIKNAFPNAYAADQATTKADPNKLGSYTAAKNGDVTVFNLYSQFGFWGRNKGLRDLNYNALYDSLDSMRNALKGLPDVRVGIPAIGAGLAGGDWKIIQAIIEQTLDQEDFPVTVYLLDEKARNNLGLRV